MNTHMEQECRRLTDERKEERREAIDLPFAAAFVPPMFVTHTAAASASASAAATTRGESRRRRRQHQRQRRGKRQECAIAVAHRHTRTSRWQSSSVHECLGRQDQGRRLSATGLRFSFHFPSLVSVSLSLSVARMRMRRQTPE